MYREIEIDRIQLTIMGVKFPNLAELERTANAIGSNMFEGFVPSRELVQLYIDWKSGAITESNLLAALYAITKK